MLVYDHCVYYPKLHQLKFLFQGLNNQANNCQNDLGFLESFHVTGKDGTGRRAAELDRFNWNCD